MATSAPWFWRFATCEGVVVTDERARIVSVNAAFSEITGYTAAEAVGQRPSLLRSEHHDAEFYRAMWQALLDSGRWQGEIWNRRKDGEVFLEWLTINRIPAADGIAASYVSVFNDITEQRRKDERIRHLAFHDALTGLPNRSLMQDRLQHAIERAQREGTRLSVTFLDLDRFKAINDTLGHDVGDQLLQEVAARIKTRLRSSDTVARMGGDEFVVLMENLRDPEYCAGVADEIIAEISRPLNIHGHAIEIGASLGVAFYPEDGDDATTLMKHADTAMYVAKADGKGIYRFFRGSMMEQATRRLKLEVELRHAIANGELELHYQPKVSLATGKVEGVEALVRWRHPALGLVSPVDFIPVAEETGLIVELGDWVLNEACRQSAAWQALGLTPKIAINVSAKQLQQDTLVERIVAVTQHHGIPAQHLEVELTESLVMADPKMAIATLARLRAIGVTVAVDDFGTGYSSLSCRSTRSRSTAPSSCTPTRTTKTRRSCAPSSPWARRSSSPSSPKAWKPQPRPRCCAQWAAIPCKAICIRAPSRRSGCWRCCGARPVAAAALLDPGQCGAARCRGTIEAMKFAWLLFLFALPAAAAPTLQALVDAAPAGAMPVRSSSNGR